MGKLRIMTFASLDFRSPCPAASALDIVGDKWTLIVIRSMFAGARRYRDFMEGPEKISTNILADRLKRLECLGLIDKLTEPGRPPTHAYRLTRTGADLLPVVQALAAWGRAHIPDRWDPPAWFVCARPEDYYPPGEEESL